MSSSLSSTLLKQVLQRNVAPRSTGRMISLLQKRWSSDAAKKSGVLSKVGEYEAPKETDHRSPCPALNALANHGYLPRDGRNISASSIISSTTTHLGLSTPLASLIAYGTLLILRKNPFFSAISLKDLASNPGVEHPASLAHVNTPADAKHGSTSVCPHLAAKLLSESRDGGFTAHDFARARVRREEESARGGEKLVGWKQEIARGECSLAINAFGNGEEKLTEDVVKTWWIGERLPEGYKPQRKTTLRSAAKVATKIRDTMTSLKNSEKGATA